MLKRGILAKGNYEHPEEGKVGFVVMRRMNAIELT
jgi:hypothetical protein